MANWANVGNLGDPLSPGWQDKNLTEVKAPNGQSWRVYKDAAPAFSALLGDLVAAGYNPTSGGGFNFRNIRGSNRLSQHAFGTSIDVSPDQNPMLNGKLQTNLPSNVADIAAKHGLEWGGTWKNRPDPMHFEWAGGPGGAQPTMMANAAPVDPAAPQPAAAPVQNPFAPPEAGLPQLALLYAQNAAAQRQRREDEQAAEVQRRSALFG